MIFEIDVARLDQLKCDVYLKSGEEYLAVDPASIPNDRLFAFGYGGGMRVFPLTDIKHIDYYYDEETG